jgi:hypothetical protein
MRTREKWRLIIQEVKAHPELQRRGEGRKEYIIICMTTQDYSLERIFNIIGYMSVFLLLHGY